MDAPGRHGATRSTSVRNANSSFGGWATSISFENFMASVPRRAGGRAVAERDVHQRLALAAVDRDVRAVEERGPRRGQERHEVGDLLPRADAPEGDRRHRELVGALLVAALVAGEALLEAVPAVGLDRPGVDRVHADALRPLLLGQ